MNSSGIRRGLAATAVSALAVAGLPFLASSASATPLVEQEADGNVTLRTPATVASFKNDGLDATAHLVATGGANVQQVQFQYSTNTADDTGPWVNVGSAVSRINGIFSAEWAPPAAIYNTTVQVRASALGSVGTEIDTDDNDVLVTANQESVNIGNAPGSQLGYFEQPYGDEDETDRLAGISGTTSDVSANPTLAFTTPYNVVSTTEDVAGTVAAGATSRTFSAPVNLNDYPEDAVAPLLDQALVIATAGGDDAEAVTLYQQTINNVTAVATTPTVQGAGTTDITVTVTDQNGQPVVGAQVVGEDAPVNQTVYTNSQGKAVFSGATGSAGGTSYDFLVNVTDEDGYQSASDFRRSATVTSYTATASSLSVTSADGVAFDFDENDSDDIQITVRDQSNAPVPAGTAVSYQWVIDPFQDGVAAPAPIDGGGNTAANGTVDVTFPVGQPAGTYTLNYWINRDGTPGEGAGDLSGTDLVVKAGQAEVVWADDDLAQAASGTTATFEGSLELEDGTGLSARSVSIVWTKNVTGNAVVAAQAAQPAGATRVSDTNATAVTAADGGFGVAIADPAAVPNVNELDGNLAATTTVTPNIGNAGASDSVSVDFLADLAVSEADTNTRQQDLDGQATPGRPVSVRIHVQNADGENLTGLPVDISTDHGFFTTSNTESGDVVDELDELVPSPAAAEDAEYGEWEDLGTETTDVTSDNGWATATLAIEGDEGFNDDGEVTASVTFEVGGETFVEEVEFSSADPLNGGEVEIVLADDQSVGVLPKAPTTEMVGFNAQVTDQFGNLVGDVDVDLSDDTTDASLDDDEVLSTFAGENASFYASADAVTDQTITGLWDNAPTTLWTDAQPLVEGFQEEDLGGNDATTTDSVDLTGESEAINWYVIDYAASMFTLVHSGASSQPVGTTVTMTYKAVDQNGEPLSGYDVVFFRTGPDDLGDGDGNSISTTNAAGEATYVFQGAKAGTATVTAVLHAPDGIPGATGELIPAGQQTDSVQFGKDAINLTAGGKNNGKKADALKVKADANAAGLVAKVFVKGKKVAQHKLNNAGDWNFTLKDKNGNKVTKYTVEVASSATTKGDSATKKLK